MGAETQSDCPFCADNARARREEFERDVLPELERLRAHYGCAVSDNETQGG